MLFLRVISTMQRKYLLCIVVISHEMYRRSSLPQLSKIFTMYNKYTTFTCTIKSVVCSLHRGTTARPKSNPLKFLIKYHRYHFIDILRRSHCKNSRGYEIMSVYWVQRIDNPVTKQKNLIHNLSFVLKPEKLELEFNFQFSTRCQNYKSAEIIVTVVVKLI